MSIAQHGRHIPKRRSGKGKLPIKNGRNLPFPLYFIHQQVGRIIIAMNEMRCVVIGQASGEAAKTRGNHRLLSGRKRGQHNWMSQDPGHKFRKIRVLKAFNPQFPVKKPRSVEAMSLYFAQ